MKFQTTMRLSAVLLPLFAYGGSAIALIGGGPVRYVPVFMVSLFSLFYASEWIDDTKTGKQLMAIGHSDSTGYVKALIVLGGFAFAVALAPFAILRFSIRLAGYSPADPQTADAAA